MKCQANPERGSALITVLIIAVILTATVLILLSFLLMQRRFVVRKAHYLQAKYSAEGGFYLTLDELAQSWHGKPWKQTVYQPAVIEEKDSANIRYFHWGGFLSLSSGSDKKGQSFELESLIGFQMTDAFDPAVRISPAYSALVVTGDTRIHGDVVCGRQGVKKGSLAGRPYSGGSLVYGKIIKTTDDRRPRIDRESIQFMFEYIRKEFSRANPVDFSSLVKDTTTEILLSEPANLSKTPVLINNDIINHRRWKISGPGVLLCREPLNIETEIELKDRIQLLCSAPITINANIKLENGILYSPDNITLSGVKNFEGQVFSETSIAVKYNSTLNYPSLLMVYSQLQSAEINLQNGCHLSGSIFCLKDTTTIAATQNQSKIVVEKGATVTGLVYSDNFTTLEGEVNGMMITDRFYFYHSPTVYHNWIKDGVVDRTKLNDNFKVPLFFKMNNPKLKAVYFK